MKNKSPKYLLGLSLAALSLATSASAATILVNSTAPTVTANDQSNLVAQTSDQKWFTDSDNIGQTFTPSGTGLSINSFTIQMSDSRGTNQDDGGESVNVELGTITRPGGVFTFTEIYSEIANLSGDWSESDYITFAFDTSQALTDGVEYGVRLDVQAFGAFQNGIPYAGISGDTYAGGQRIGQNTSSASGDMIFHVDIVPEPSTALLGALGFLALLRRRR